MGLHAAGFHRPYILIDDAIADIQFVRVLPIPRVAYMDIIRGIKATAYGSEGKSVVAIYTRKGYAGINTPQNAKNFTHAGYYKARVFYEPRYDKKREEHIKPDYRTTLHWQPNVKIPRGSATELSFYTADKSSKFRVVLEGIAENGSPLRGVYYFDVQ